MIEEAYRRKNREIGFAGHEEKKGCPQLSRGKFVEKEIKDIAKNGGQLA